MPEVGLDLAAYASPYSPQQFLDAMREYTDPTLRKQSEERILSHYKARTWADCGNEFMEILRAE